MNKTTLALYFGDRDLFPATMINQAKREIIEAVKKHNLDFIIPPEDLFPKGGVACETDGQKYAAFLKQNEGKFDGVILCLPNFGDENGAVAALRDANVPILIHAYPDELNKMGPEERRDAFCGKFSVMDVFTQFGIPFTALTPHTIHPGTPVFQQHLATFSGICRVVKGMKRFKMGAIGARTSAFKTVRFDELTLEKYGITTESVDLSEVFHRVEHIEESSTNYKIKADTLSSYTCWQGVPDRSFTNLVKLSVVLDDLIEELKLDSLAVRCWIEIEKILKVSPCVVLSELNNRGIATACEMDGGNAIAMHALNLATGGPSACLDWNNNYGNEENKCILFHCGPVPQQMMTAKGQVVDHPMFARVLGEGCGFGCNVGRISPSSFSYASGMTKNGRLIFYLGEGEFTKDNIADNFFGCAGVAEIPDLQNKLNRIGTSGFRHHVSTSFGKVANILKRSFSEYLNYDIMDF